MTGTLLPHVALALVGSGVLAVFQGFVADHCTNAQLKDMVLLGAFITAAFWWVAVIGALGFALAGSGTWLGAFAAHTCLVASALTAFTAVGMIAAETVVCDFFRSDKLTKRVGEMFIYSIVAAVFALAWRGVSGGQ